MGLRFQVVRLFGLKTLHSGRITAERSQRASSSLRSRFQRSLKFSRLGLLSLGHYEGIRLALISCTPKRKDGIKVPVASEFDARAAQDQVSDSTLEHRLVGNGGEVGVPGDEEQTGKVWLSGFSVERVD